MLTVDSVVHTPGLVPDHEALLGLLAREVADVVLAPLEHKWRAAALFVVSLPLLPPGFVQDSSDSVLAGVAGGVVGCEADDVGYLRDLEAELALQLPRLPKHLLDHFHLGDGCVITELHDSRGQIPDHLFSFLTLPFPPKVDAEELPATVGGAVHHEWKGLRG